MAGKIAGSDFEHQRFIADGPKGVGQDARSNAHVRQAEVRITVRCKTTIRIGELAEWLKAHPC